MAGVDKPVANGCGNYPLASRFPAEVAADAFTLKAFLGQVLHHWMLVATVVGLATMAAVLVVFQLTPRYTAESEVLIETRSMNVVDID